MDGTDQPCSPDRGSKGGSAPRQPFSQKCRITAGISPAKLTLSQIAAVRSAAAGQTDLCLCWPYCSPSEVESLLEKSQTMSTGAHDLDRHA